MSERINERIMGSWMMRFVNYRGMKGMITTMTTLVLVGVEFDVAIS